MSKENAAEITQMNWQDVRAVLQNSQGKERGAAESDEENALRLYFGEAEFENLRKLSANAEQTRALLGNVILLPGIMGSELSIADENGAPDLIWVNMWRLFRGKFGKLKSARDVANNVLATGLYKKYYTRALETLQAEPFPYDWRLDIGAAAENLAKLVTEKFAAQKVSFVAHSMGGLVVREFIRRHPALWTQAQGRLIMLGTPNAGSFAAVKTLLGGNSLLSKIALFDFCNDKDQLNEIIRTFYGLYQLCPSKTKLAEIYEPSFWQKFPSILFDDCLMKVPDFYQQLSDLPATVDPQRMTYIAGTGFETPSVLKPLGNGEYDFETTTDGDGTVPHALGLLEGVPAYYVQEEHGELPKNKDVLQAVAEILQTGATAHLPAEKPVLVKKREILDLSRQDVEEIESVVRQIRDNEKPEPLLVYDAEEKFFRALFNHSTGAREADCEEVESLNELKSEEKPLEVSVQSVRGYIEACEARVIVIGQYENLPPTGSIGAIDEALGGWITLAQQNNMFAAGLGNLFTIPTLGNHLNQRTDLVVVAGMGPFNRFNHDDLRYLTMNVILGVRTLGYAEMAMVLLGMGGKSSLTSVDRTVRSILLGVRDALQRVPKKVDQQKEFKLLLIEKDAKRHQKINDALEKVAAHNDSRKNAAQSNILPVEGLKVRVAPPAVTKAKTKNKKSPFFGVDEEREAQQEVGRLVVERQGDKFSLSALGSLAAIPVREITTQKFIIDSSIEKIRRAGTPEEQKNLGRLLHSLLIPEDFQSFIDTNSSLVLILNREAAGIPWEMLSYKGISGTSNFARDLRVSRQFSSAAASVPSVAPPINKTIKALVIADPCEEPRLRLPGARAEGESLKEFFTDLRPKLAQKGIEFKYKTCIGHHECNIVDILSLIFNVNFDIIHFAGHGVYVSPKAEANNGKSLSGWVFGENRILSAHEIFRLRRVPRLVFANACFSAKIVADAGDSSRADDEVLSSNETSQQLAGLAEAFFLRGIENYIGTGWAVGDANAVEFAKKFYEQTLMEGKSLGFALSDARAGIIPEQKDECTDSTWAAYQHYGDSNKKLIGEI